MRRQFQLAAALLLGAIAATAAPPSPLNKSMNLFPMYDNDNFIIFTLKWIGEFVLNVAAPNSCGVSHDRRQDCGFLGVSKEQCERQG